MASWFATVTNKENSQIIKQALPKYTKKVTKFGLEVFVRKGLSVLGLKWIKNSTKQQSSDDQLKLWSSKLFKMRIVTFELSKNSWGKRIIKIGHFRVAKSLTFFDEAKCKTFFVKMSRIWVRIKKSKVKWTKISTFFILVQF